MSVPASRDDKYLGLQPTAFAICQHEGADRVGFQVRKDRAAIDHQDRYPADDQIGHRLGHAAIWHGGNVETLLSLE